MGMIHCEYARLAADDFDKARTDPTWALEHIDELAGEWVQMDLPAQEARYFSIGTVWGPLHNVLRTHGEMPVDPVQGGAALGSAKGITPVRYLGPEDVEKAAAFLVGTSFDTLAPLADTTRVCDEEVCPDPSEHATETDAERLGQAYGELAAFYGAAAEAGDAVVLMLN
ncbi:DUF1877 family protein [Promicromonospora iranensis]|uniref:DUF1877 family protein n=1 Tax=Promicromonospora iranensis TaxID=1105144 RepID=A0ABU2CJV2_9MICO|nr:DUF1877 family protein [Promicromonospora iranensis]MDR7381619.1 hypothetical protein [Promicromonospora iranensis]